MLLACIITGIADERRWTTLGLRKTYIYKQGQRNGTRTIRADVCPEIHVRSLAFGQSEPMLSITYCPDREQIKSDIKSRHKLYTLARTCLLMMNTTDILIDHYFLYQNLVGLMHCYTRIWIFWQVRIVHKKRSSNSNTVLIIYFFFFS